MILIPDSIFPTNSEGKPICPKCQKIIAECSCPSYDPTKPKLEQFSPVVKLDKSNRHGKMVTVISGLPKDETYLKDLAKTLKTKTGSGGTFYITAEGGVVEIQGDHVKKVVEVIKVVKEVKEVKEKAIDGKTNKKKC
ncbi:MAG: stress response translation initiation inhibitor YciH [Candidatus Omnitrophica bacterium]|nr:stress response translation initiation inhibitor YciH [Candidatus Omnitrophota bacterium]